MKKNAIILTSGLSGSSVLAHLISRMHYWKGDETFKKNGYDTHENPELIAMNEQLFKAANYGDTYSTVFSHKAICDIAAIHNNIDTAPYQIFIDHCNAHQPWIWKDPRLWVTIRFWIQLLDPSKVKFILLDRDQRQRWISITLRRQIQSFAYCKHYEDQIYQSMQEFLKTNGLNYLEIKFEELIIEPQATIDKLNEYLDGELTLKDLTTIYNKPLYKMPRGIKDYIKAQLIYYKNYSQRSKL